MSLWSVVLGHCVPRTAVVAVSVTAVVRTVRFVVVVSPGPALLVLVGSVVVIVAGSGAAASSDSLKCAVAA